LSEFMSQCGRYLKLLAYLNRKKQNINIQVWEVKTNYPLKEIKI
jgi:hypothetical protein